MRFTFLVVAVACQATALRPELSRSSVSRHIASVGDIMSKVSSPSDSLAALKAATVMLDGVLAETGNATDHISGDDAVLLGSVVDLVEKTIYSSMDQSHDADAHALADAVDTTAQCNMDIANRQSPDGDLGTLQRHLTYKQTELDMHQREVDDKTTANNTKWTEFDSHMNMISHPPVCPPFPDRKMAALDVFFEKSEYAIWFAIQQASYNTVRDAFKDADSALEDAIDQYNIQKAVRDQQYCDWKTELEAACVAFDVCFSDASDFFTSKLVPRVTSDMNGRIDVKKAGDTLIHQISFLLAEVNDQQTPPVDTTRFELTFPVLPEKGLCDLNPLDDAVWVPKPSCDMEVSYAGTYEVWYAGAKRSTDLIIACDNTVSGNGGSGMLSFVGVDKQCTGTRDTSSTMYRLNPHGANKHECLHKDGDNIVGNHYVKSGQFWGTIEYRLIQATSCPAP